jgi:hypothetical protein
LGNTEKMDPNSNSSQNGVNTISDDSSDKPYSLLNSASRKSADFTYSSNLLLSNNLSNLSNEVSGSTQSHSSMRANPFRRDVSSNFSINNLNFDSKDDDDMSEYDGSNVLISLLLLNKRKKSSCNNLTNVSSNLCTPNMSAARKSLTSQAAIFHDSCDIDSSPAIVLQKNSSPVTMIFSEVPSFEFDEVDTSNTKRMSGDKSLMGNNDKNSTLGVNRYVE